MSVNSSLSAWFFRYRYAVILMTMAAIWALNLHLDMMELDATQYAAISREMAMTGQYLQVYYRGEDYLDKPPLLFWVSSAGISILQNTNIGYKLPAVSILMLSLWGLFRFTRLWYTSRTAWIAVIMFATTQAFHLMSHDVRTDGLLTSFVVLSVYGYASFLKNGNRWHLVLAGISTGCAMLAKGPIGAVIPAVAIGGHLLASGQWKLIFRWHWWLALLPVLVTIAPMCYGLYQQFDLHPEKEVYGLKGPSGLEFYFWTQSFGRITGENYWDNQTPWYYFLQTLLWDMQPWLLVLLPGIGMRIRDWWYRKKNNHHREEWITLFGFVVPLIALSFSHYKLPHYIFPLFPFAAVMGAHFLERMADRLPQWFEVLQLIFIHLLILAGLVILLWVFPDPPVFLFAMIPMLYICLWAWRSNAGDASTRLIYSSLAGVLLFQLVLSAHFYPRLLGYQSTSQVGKFIRQYPDKEVFWLHKFGHATEYYAGRSVPYASGMTAENYPGKWIYIDQKEQPTMPPHRVIRAFPDYPVTKLKWSFLHPKTRDQVVKTMLLVEIDDPGTGRQ